MAGRQWSEEEDNEGVGRRRRSEGGRDRRVCVLLGGDGCMLKKRMRESVCAKMCYPIYHFFTFLYFILMESEITFH